MFRRQKKEDRTYLLDGVWSADTMLAQQSEHRALTLLLKAGVVYCLVGGGMGCLLSALTVDYHAVALQLMLLLTSIVLAFLYYNHLSENVGYILIFIVMLAGAYLLRNYINSGFYSVMNDLAEAISDYFESDAVRSYGERITNRALAVTISMCYIGVVCCLIINILVSRNMRYLMLFLAVAFCLFMPLYLELEPQLFYVVQFLWGMFMVYMLRRSHHYKLTVSNRKYKQKKNRFSYIYSIRTIVQAGMITGAVILAVSVFMAVIAPKELYHEKHPSGTWKKQTAETVENLSIVGVAGLFNFYDNVGGLTSGRLGGVSSIRLDYETDLTLTFVPTSEERFYLRQFVGGEYLPVANRWEAVPELSLQMEEALQQSYQKGESGIGRGRIQVDNVAGETGVYLPYFSTEIDKSVWTGRSQSYTYYNTDYMYNVRHPIPGINWRQEKNRELYLDMPVQDAEAVDKTIERAGMASSLSPVENVAKLGSYFAENIPYSYKPGITPYRKDFVHYFLLENRRGYCAHFASAATLIFRRLGIPARYVEGYAIDPDDIGEEGQMLMDANVEDYHQGYTELSQSGVIRVNVVDANAHAWVEIWLEGQGWRVVDITPAAEGSEEGQSVWNTFMRIFGGRPGSETAEGIDTNGSQAEEEREKNNQNLRSLLQITAGALGMILFLFLLVIGIRFSYRRICYVRMERNDKLVHYYQRYIRKMGHDVMGLKERNNYEEQINLLLARGKLKLEAEEKKRFLSIMERAGFGPHEISEEDDKWLRGKLRKE